MRSGLFGEKILRRKSKIAVKVYGAILNTVLIFFMALFSGIQKIFNGQEVKKTDDNQTVAQSEFISFAAHQLKTPLAGIKWTLKMLINGEVGSLTEEQRSMLVKSYDSNELVIRLIDQMLSADRMRSGFKLSFVESNIVNILETEVREIMPVAKNKNIHIEIEAVSKEVPPVYIDAERIRSVFQNLLENSIRYTNNNGLITVSIKKQEGSLLVSVKDNGIGIPKDSQKDIFRKFFRAPNAIKVETNGSGLGLFIAKSIVVGHGGEIWFETEEGVGTTFYFTIPLSKPKI